MSRSKILKTSVTKAKGIRLRSLEEYDAIAKPLLKGAHFQWSRHEVIRSTIEAWFLSHAEQKEAKKEEGEQPQETTYFE